MYTDEQIKQFIQQQGIADNPYALYNYAKQLGVAPGRLDSVLGLAPGTSDRWIQSQGLQGLAGSAVGGTRPTTGTYSDGQINQFIDQRGIRDNPHALQAFGGQYGVDAGRMDQALGAQPGQSAGWQQQAGLGGPLPSDYNTATALGNGYSADQIRQYIQQQGIGNNPQAMWDAAQKYGVSPGQVDQAQGYKPGTSDAWIKQQGQRGQTGQARDSVITPDQRAHLEANRGQLGQPIPGGQNTAPPPSNNPYLPGGQPTGQQSQNPYMPGGGMPGFNPATNWMADTIAKRTGDALGRNILPGIRSAASLAGGLGGSRQGVMEGMAIGDSMSGLSGALAGLYSGQYNADRGYGLQSDALDLNAYNSNQQWMRQGQQDQIGFLDKMLGWQGQGVNAATQTREQPFNDWNKFVGPAAQIGGMGGTNSTPYYGNPVMGAIGGYQLGNNLYNSWNKPS